MRKSKKHLNFYKNCLHIGEIPRNGLCSCAQKGMISMTKLDLLTPDDDELDKYSGNGFWSYIYWGFGEKYDAYTSRYDLRRKFTTLRQNIVLFIAAMNNEL
jgi:hypothetical protein